MKISTLKSTWIAAGLGISLLAGSPAFGDDTELLLLNPDGSLDPKPNILFILDTSGSMGSTETTTNPYDSTQPNPGTCDETRVYWTDVDVTPDCSTSLNYVEGSSFHCDFAGRQMDGIGSYTNTMVQYRGGGKDGTSGGPDRWQYLATGYHTEPVECQADSGVHGDGRATYLYASNGTNLSDPYTTDSGSELSWGSAPRNLGYTFYSGKYLNWKNSPSTVSMTRAAIMQVVTKKVLSSVGNLNVGLMRFNDLQGGVVSTAIKDLDTNRQELLDMIDTFDPDSWTPLSETMYEAALYWRGMSAHYGNSINEHPTDALAVTSAPPTMVYDAPPLDACAKNYNVLLTDGAPTQDDDGPVRIPTLPNFGPAMGSATCTGSGQGMCLDDVAKYLSIYDIDPVQDGDQLVTTHTIGFAVDLPILLNTAIGSGGEYFLADDVETLTKTLLSILANINDRTISFAAPAVSVNTFNRTQNLNDLYITVFGARAKTHWPGNVKKYRIVDREIVDMGDIAAVDVTTGFFKDTARSYWSAITDGNEVRKGGAANLLPDPSSRNLYTNNSGTVLTAAANAVSPGNMGAFLDSDFGLTGATGEPSKEDVIRWARGEDLRDTNLSSLIRYEMGDPLHSQPAAIVYGGTEASPEMVVFMATNDGYLHAIDASTGVELWSFIPKQLLSNLTRLYFDPNSKYKQYGIDGNIVPTTKDVDGDGIIEPADGDFVRIVFGMRRGGNTLFALDVTDKTSPELMWTSSLPEWGDTWSSPVISRMDIASVTQNTDNAVIVVGGGYDTVHDTNTHPSVDDAMGAGIHILDLETGAELWRTGSDSGADLTLSTMNRSIATEVRVIDFSGDGFADRMYASDMGGRIWRFDIYNGQAPANLVTGGVIAELGAEGTGVSALDDTRRFYNAPDVSIFTDNVQQRRFIAISIGSGYRTHPFDLAANDRFYSIRDPDVFTKLDQSAYSTYSIVDDSNLVEVSGQVGAVITSSDRGWKFTVPDNQKILADSLTFSDEIFFVSFSPDANVTSTCGTGKGTNFLYRMSIVNGDPIVPNLSTLDPLLSDDERRQTLQQGGIAPSPMMLFPSPPSTCPSGHDCSEPPLACIGVECFDPGFDNNPVRTLWTQDGIE
jgi:type IV pilus assembly protein PilY1